MFNFRREFLSSFPSEKYFLISIFAGVMRLAAWEKMRMQVEGSLEEQSDWNICKETKVGTPRKSRKKSHKNAICKINTRKFLVVDSTFAFKLVQTSLEFKSCTRKSFLKRIPTDSLLILKMSITNCNNFNSFHNFSFLLLHGGVSCRRSIKNCHRHQQWTMMWMKLRSFRIFTIEMTLCSVQLDSFTSYLFPLDHKIILRVSSCPYMICMPWTRGWFTWALTKFT